MSEEIDNAVAEYVAEYGVTSTRTIAYAVSLVLDYTPSTATIADALRRLGYTPQKVHWTKDDE